MNIAIVDDQKEFLDIIRETVSCLEYDFYSFTSVYDMEKTGILFDLVLLDIDMPDCDGIDYAKKHKNLNIIFITSRDDKVKDAFGNNVYGFISKSDSKERYIKVIDEVLPQVNQKIITIKSGKDDFYFVERYIVYLMYIGYKRISLVYNNKSYTIKGYSLKEIKEALSEEFIYIDKSTIVNRQMIVHFAQDELYLRSIEQSFPVSRRMRKMIQKHNDERGIKQK